MNDKTFEIVISFLEPSQAVVTIAATGEEDAINKLKAELEGQIDNLRILNIKEIDKSITVPATTELH